jgi:hypothetical protein
MTGPCVKNGVKFGRDFACKRQIIIPAFAKMERGDENETPKTTDPVCSDIGDCIAVADATAGKLAGAESAGTKLPDTADANGCAVANFGAD